MPRTNPPAIVGLIVLGASVAALYGAPTLMPILSPTVASTPAPAAALPAASVPTGVKIAASLGETLTSGTAKVGDTFSFATVGLQKIGDVVLPAGSRGTGRVAAVTPGRKGHDGSLALLADAIATPDGHAIWVNMDTKPIRGHYANRHVIPYVLPIVPVIVPGALVTHTGDLVIDSGTRLTLVTIPPRSAPAPIPPTPVPAVTPSP